MNTNTIFATNHPEITWQLSASAWFRRTKDPLGKFSNFTTGLPIAIHGFKIPSSEHLYQAMRFPHLPDIQFQILTADSPKTSKTIARDNEASTRSDWNEIRVAVMRWVITKKILANRKPMEKVFAMSGDLPIVEYSKRDSFWGAEPHEDNDDLVSGRNVLGCVLTELRAVFRADARMRASSAPEFPKALILSKPV